MTFKVYSKYSDPLDVKAFSFNQAITIAFDLYCIYEDDILGISMDEYSFDDDMSSEDDSYIEVLESKVDTLELEIDELKEATKIELENNPEFMKYKTGYFFYKKIAEEYLDIKKFTELKIKELSEQMKKIN